MRKVNNTRDKILQEAMAAFTRHGYEGARIDKIASAVGINKASLYFHFKSKEELFRELFKGVVKRYNSFLNRIVLSGKGLSAKQRLIGFYNDFLHDSWCNPEIDFWNRIYYLPPEEMKQEIYSITKNDKMNFMNVLKTVFEEGISNGEISSQDIEKMVTVFYYLLTCISLSTDIMSEREGIAEMDNCFEIFWKGIKK